MNAGAPLRLALVLGFSTFSTAGITAPMHDVLIGTYTENDSQGIYHLRFDGQSGRLDPAPVQVISSQNPSWLTLDAEQRLLFATNENGPGKPDPVGRVSSFSIDPKDRTLTPIGQQMTLGDEPTHASLTPDGRYLLVANYGSREDPGGSLVVMPVDEQGRPGPVTQLSTHQASGVNPERQRSSHVHSAVLSPDGRHVFSSDLGADKVFVYRYQPDNQERPLQPAEPAEVSLPPGSGPRHLVFSPDGRHAFLTLELTAQVARFSHDDGRLTQRQLVDLVGEADGRRHSAGAIHPSPDGRFLYVSDRGEVNRILVFSIAEDGELREIQRRDVEGKEPREFAFDPSGRFLLVANQLSDEIVVLRRDPQSGELGEKVQALPLSRPSSIRFLNTP